MSGTVITVYIGTAIMFYPQRAMRQISEISYVGYVRIRFSFFRSFFLPSLSICDRQRFSIARSCERTRNIFSNTFSRYRITMGSQSVVSRRIRCVFFFRRRAAIELRSEYINPYTSNCFITPVQFDKHSINGVAWGSTCRVAFART